MRKLLIVDDENDVREFAASFFRRRKVEVETASSGEGALEALAGYRPDLVLLDIKLPGIDGIETLRHIRLKDKDTKVIMVTGKKPDEEDAFEKCRSLGVTGYVHKPLVLEELERIVMTALGEPEEGQAGKIEL